MAVLLPFAFAAACSNEAPPGGEAAQAGRPIQTGSNRPPSIRSAAVTPAPITLNEPVSVVVNGADPDGDPVTYRYQWLANGTALDGQRNASLVPHQLRRGDLVAVEVTPLDGKVAGAPYRTEPVAVGNTPPEVTSLVLEPSPARVGDTLQAKVEGKDADQDPIRYAFKWWKNNLPISGGEAGILETAGFARGDELVAQATPHDAAGSGKPLFSQPVRIANSPPRITSAPPASISQGLYGYAVAATDPDGDPLLYELEAAPPGMSIDKASGRIQWRITAETKGTHRVRVSVRDNQDGYAFQEFDLNLPAS